MNESQTTGQVTPCDRTADLARPIPFMSGGARICTISTALSDIERTCGESPIADLDQREDSVGTRVEIGDIPIAAAYTESAA